MTNELDQTHEETEPTGSGATATLVLTTAELAECTCPEFCERDHDLD